MKKIFFIILIAFSLNAKIIDKVVASVNGEPITSYDIQVTSKKLNIPKNQALNYLIDQELIKSEIKKLGITVDAYEIDEAMNKIAQRNHLTLFELQNILMQKGEYKEFKKKLKENLLKEKLFENIVNSQLKITPQQIKNYYNTHKNEFSIFKTIQVVKYSANNPEILKKLFNNPFYSDKNIISQTEIYQWNKLPLNKLYLFKNTKVGQYTPIVNEGLSFVTYYIVNKKGKVYLPFNRVKNIIANQILQEERNRILQDYFDEIKNRADIKIYK